MALSARRHLSTLLVVNLTFEYKPFLHTLQSLFTTGKKTFAPFARYFPFLFCLENSHTQAVGGMDSTAIGGKGMDSRVPARDCGVCVYVLSARECVYVCVCACMYPVFEFVQRTPIFPSQRQILHL